MDVSVFDKLAQVIIENLAGDIAALLLFMFASLEGVVIVTLWRRLAKHEQYLEAQIQWARDILSRVTRQ